MATISIIVPIYNARESIAKCVESILMQTYADFELILIDDGSLDESGIICDKYALIDNRIQVIHKNNEGVSSARNDGIKNATGQWITFVDSDDYVAIDYLSTLLNASEDPNALIMQGLYKCQGNVITETINFSAKEFKKENMYEAFGKYYIFDKGYTAGKLYSREIIVNNNICFNRNISYAEDLIFMLQYIEHINHIIFIKGSNYYYQVGASILSQRINPFENEYMLFNEYMSAIDRIHKKFDFTTPNETKNYGALLLMRSIYALYSRNEKNIYNKIIRLRYQYEDFIKAYYRPQITLMKFFKILLLWCPILFHICCKYKFVK